MWLMDYITKNSLKSSQACKGSYSSGSEGAAVQSEGEHKQLGQCQPYGIVSLPPNGSEAVVLPLADGEVTLGVLNGGVGVQPGEIALFSSGGASILLKNNGDVIINGQVFSND